MEHTSGNRFLTDVLNFDPFATFMVIIFGFVIIDLLNVLYKIVTGEGNTDDNIVQENDDITGENEIQDGEHDVQQQHVPFKYNPKTHFIQFLTNISQRVPFTISINDISKIVERLDALEIKLETVTFRQIEKTLRYLSKNVDKKYSKYLNVRNIGRIATLIRGRPIIEFTNEEVEGIKQTFETVYKSWHIHKDEKRKNFVTHPNVLLLILKIRGYPKETLDIVYDNFFTHQSTEKEDIVYSLILRDHGFEDARLFDQTLSVCSKLHN